MYLAGGSFAVGVIHAGVCPEHFREATLFGLFFAAVAVAQLLWAATVIRRVSRSVLTTGIALQLSAAAVWLASRTTGLPVGPERWHREGIGVLDVVSTLIEVVVALGAIRMLAGDRLPSLVAVARRTFRRLWRWLPEGGVLPDDVWAQRHRAILIVLWLHFPGLMVFGLLRGLSSLEMVVHGVILLTTSLAATLVHRRRPATVLTAVALLTCSAVLVRMSGGVIEMHFHYFVMVGVVTLYQDWWPFLIAIAYVVVQHGLAGIIDPSAVYNHAEAVDHPWEWAGIHGLFVLAMSSAGVASWRLNESFLGHVTERQHQLDGALSLLTATLDATADGILVVDVDGRISSYNERFVDMWGIPRDILASRDDERAIAFVLSQLRDPDAFVAKVRELYAQPESESHDVLEFVDGRIVERYSTPQRVDGQIVGRVWSFHDVTERARLEVELAHQAFHDSLTSLANQALFRDRVTHALARTARQPASLGVLFVDLDDFKTINDSLGHSVGDELLVAVGERLCNNLRVTDTAARLGGDEFAVLIEDAKDADDVVASAERIVMALRQPFHAGGRDVHIHASVGIALAGEGATCDHLLRNADLAMYTAKRQGKDRCALFEAEMHEAALARLELEADLRRGLAEDELVVHYQPIVDTITQRTVGTEALVRWDHPERGVLPPSAFIPLAEETGLIVELGRQVLLSACMQTRAWQQSGAPSDLYVSVNLSARQLQARDLVADVGECLTMSGLAPSCLVLEITETAMMQDIDAAITQLHALKSLGLRIALDDFGTGYSSLSYLQRLPVDLLKIDRAFVAAVDGPEGEDSFANTILSLARTLHLPAIAEGVETASQAAALVRLGCELAQGYLYARPSPAQDVAFVPAASANVGASGPA